MPEQITEMSVQMSNKVLLGFYRIVYYNAPIRRRMGAQYGKNGLNIY